HVARHTQSRLEQGRLSAGRQEEVTEDPLASLKQGLEDLAHGWPPIANDIKARLDPFLSVLTAEYRREIVVELKTCVNNIAGIMRRAAEKKLDESPNEVQSPASDLVTGINL